MWRKRHQNYLLYNGPHPGPHPDPDHDFNKNPQDAKPGQKIDHMGIRIINPNARLTEFYDNGEDDGY